MLDEMQHQIWNCWNCHGAELVASLLLEIDTKLHKDDGGLHWNLNINTQNHQYTISQLLLLQHHLQILIVASYF